MFYLALEEPNNTIVNWKAAQGKTRPRLIFAVCRSKSPQVLGEKPVRMGYIKRTRSFKDEKMIKPRKKAGSLTFREEPETP